MDELEVLEQHTKERLSSNKPLFIGPFLSAGILDALFCGFLLMQAGKYVMSRRRDSLLLQLGAAYVILMNLAGSALTWVWVYDLFVCNFGTYYLFQSSKYISWFFIFNSTTVVVVQVYFGWRAWMLTGKNTNVAVVIGALIVCALGGGIGMKVVCSQLGSVWDPKGIRIPTYICASCTVAADSTITGIILYFLLSNRSGCTSRITRVIDRTIRITFESQLPPTISAITVSLVYLFNEDGFIYIPILVIKLKLYAISFLHTLNSRPQRSRSTFEMTCPKRVQDSHPTTWNTEPGMYTSPSTPFSSQQAEVCVSVVSFVTSEQVISKAEAEVAHPTHPQRG
ncbi:unnamed protein product [Rhizoctonia solani]|uniref:DUF6534 domain-containing protein n=1 Tax=Rhizoctonia solani TaxID=456999 RepID=A0A8H3GSU1_9AGAM|nr:unnamed protein product [Rhizoctonia solani]